MARTRRMLALSAVVGASLLLAACGGGAAPAAATQAGTPAATDVQITLTDFHIQSSMTVFKVDVPYHFIITNDGAVAHEFLIIPPTEGPVPNEEALKMALTGVQSENLQPSETATLDYTFLEPAPAGTLEFACHLPGHYEAGMHLSITVE
jgi:uncharacterized cupredoxin-like copper-binding protein